MIIIIIHRTNKIYNTSPDLFVENKVMKQRGKGEFIVEGGLDWSNDGIQ